MGRTAWWNGLFDSRKVAEEWENSSPEPRTKPMTAKEFAAEYFDRNHPAEPRTPEEEAEYTAEMAFERWKDDRDIAWAEAHPDEGAATTDEF